MKPITGRTALAWLPALMARKGLTGDGFSFINTRGQHVSVYLDDRTGPTLCWASESLQIANYELGEGRTCPAMVQ